MCLSTPLRRRGVRRSTALRISLTPSLGQGGGGGVDLKLYCCCCSWSEAVFIDVNFWRRWWHVVPKNHVLSQRTDFLFASNNLGYQTFDYWKNQLETLILVCYFHSYCHTPEDVLMLEKKIHIVQKSEQSAIQNVQGKVQFTVVRILPCKACVTGMSCPYNTKYLTSSYWHHS